MRSRPAAAAAAVAALLALPAAPAVAGDSGGSGGERIRSYDVALDVRGDGSLRVAETISYDFGGTQRHGIERDIDNEQRSDGSRDRVYPIRDVEVSSETAPDQVQVSESGGELRLRIGDPDRTVTGTHTYRIGYTALAATTRFADRDELY